MLAKVMVSSKALIGLEFPLPKVGPQFLPVGLLECPPDMGIGFPWSE